MSASTVATSDSASLTTVPQVLARRARETPDRTAFLWLSDGREVTDDISYQALDLQARRMAHRLLDEVSPGERVLLMCAPGPDYVVALFGCMYAGAIAVPAYPPSPFMLERELERLATVVSDARARLAVTTTPWLELAESAGMECDGRPVRWVCADDLPEAEADLPGPPAMAADDISFLQYTSGSTSEPKGVIVTYGNLATNIGLMGEVFGFGEGQTAVTWLPPYHDMGLIGLILGGIVLGVRCVGMPPDAFLRAPIRWLEAISKYRARGTAAPNFAFELCVRRTKPEQRTSLDLSCWEVAINGAEPVGSDSVARFVEAFEPSGFRRESMWPAYGLAEITLLTCSGSLGRSASTFRLDPTAFAEGRLVPTDDPDARAFTSCGTPPTATTVEILEPGTDRVLPDGEIGEIALTGGSVTAGYWAQPELTAETFQACPDGSVRLRTGDLGGFVNGELLVTGRIKDLIIVRGRNHYPQDIEATVAGAHPELRRGCGAAFSIEAPGGEQLVIVQEVRDQELDDTESVVTAITHAVTANHNLTVSSVALIAPRTIPKTSSGKVRRNATKEAFRTGTLPSVVREWPSGG